MTAPRSTRVTRAGWSFEDRKGSKSDSNRSFQPRVFSFIPVSCRFRARVSAPESIRFAGNQQSGPRGRALSPCCDQPLKRQLRQDLVSFGRDSNTSSRAPFNASWVPCRLMTFRPSCSPEGHNVTPDTLQKQRHSSLQVRFGARDSAQLPGAPIQVGLPAGVVSRLNGRGGFGKALVPRVADIYDACLQKIRIGDPSLLA